jgi:ribokinase
MTETNACRDAPRGHIVVLGSLNADLVIQVPRLPRAAETVMGEALRTFPGGKGANQAVAAARLGGAVSMVGRVGQDALGDMLLASLHADGVETSGVARSPGVSTGAALILVETGGQNMIAVAPGANREVDASDVERAATWLNTPHDLLLVQLEVPLRAVEASVRTARERGCRVILNAAPASTPLPGSLLELIDVLVVNEVEAATLFNCSVSNLDEAATAGHAARHAGAGAAIVTLGAAGAVLVAAGGPSHIPAYSVNAVDATAAGDAFVGALGLALVSGADLNSAARLGAAAGAAAATRLGAQSSLPRPADLRALLGDHDYAEGWAAHIFDDKRDCVSVLKRHA